MGLIAIGAALAIGLETIDPEIGKGLAAAKGLEGMEHQPEAAGMFRTNMILSFAFMESLSIYGLLSAVQRGGAVYRHTGEIPAAQGNDSGI